MVIAAVGTFHQIVNYVMSVEMIFLTLTGFSLFVIRRRDARISDLSAGSMPGHPLTTWLFIAVNLAVIFNLFYEFPLNSIVGVGLALAGVPVYFCWRFWAAAPPASGAC
jgi:APA family basic amino acid/polyamine antiporter